MRLHGLEFSARERWGKLREGPLFVVGLATAAIGAFLSITAELAQGELDAFDQQVLMRLAAMRRPFLNAIAVDITALGSATIVTLVAIVAGALLLMGKEWRSFTQMALASVGGALLTTLLKHTLERPRPAIVPKLVEVAGYSYPSGHSLAAASVYLTLVLIVVPRIPRRSERIVAWTLAAMGILAVGGSRSYLGVHYPSDVAAGLLLGSGWALLASAAMRFGVRKAREADVLPASATR